MGKGRLEVFSDGVIAIIIRHHGADSKLAHAVGSDYKGKVSLAAYVLAVPVALLGYAWPAGVLLMLVAIIWLMPDPRIEKVLSE